MGEFVKLLMDAGREFRLKLKVTCLPPKAKKGQALVKVTIYNLRRSEKLTNRAKIEFIE